MFKLTKIINSPTNVPDIVKLPYSRCCDIYKGYVYACVDDTIRKDFNYEYPFRYFMPIENVKMNAKQDTVSGFFITNDMIFECNERNDRMPEDNVWHAGYFAEIDFGDYGGGGATSDDTESKNLYLLDISEYDKTGWYTVQFNI